MRWTSVPTARRPGKFTHFATAGAGPGYRPSVKCASPGNPCSFAAAVLPGQCRSAMLQERPPRVVPWSPERNDDPTSHDPAGHGPRGLQPPRRRAAARRGRHRAGRDDRPGFELLRQHRPRRRAHRRRAHDPDRHAEGHVQGLDQARRQQPDDQGAAAARRTRRHARSLRGLRQLLPGRRHRVLLLRPAGLRLQRPAATSPRSGRSPPLRRRGGAGAPGARPGRRTTSTCYGQSWGGILAIEYALAAPASTSRAW